MFSRPPYPYSTSTAAPTQNPSGYISPGNLKSLPSIHEAIPYGQTSSVHAQSFLDAPKGPPNPFSQSIPPEQPKSSSITVNNVESRPPLSHHSFSDSYASHDAARSPITFQGRNGNPTPPAFPYSGDPFLATKTEDQRFLFGRNGPGAPYGDSVKRHLDVFDVGLALNEVW
jgi:hypothetical protein